MSVTTAQDPGMRAAYSTLPGVTVHTTGPGGASITSLIELQKGTTDITFALADVTYLAFTGQLDGLVGPFNHLRGVAMLNVNTFHFFAGRDTGISSVPQLKGRRVAIGPVGASTVLIAETLLKAHGLTLKDVVSEKARYPETVDRLSRREIDAALMTQIVGSPEVTRAAQTGAKLLDVDGPVVEDLRQRRPFLRRALIPAGVYAGQQKPVHTLAVDRVLICRDDLAEDIVYELLEAYFATAPAGGPSSFDLERAPATPLPLHPGAARYYRQRELSR